MREERKSSILGHRKRERQGDTETDRKTERDRE